MANAHARKRVHQEFEFGARPLWKSKEVFHVSRLTLMRLCIVSGEWLSVVWTFPKQACCGMRNENLLQCWYRCMCFAASPEVECQTLFSRCQTASRIVVSAAAISLNVGGAPQFQVWSDASSCNFRKVICRHLGLFNVYGAHLPEMDCDHAWQAERELLETRPRCVGSFRPFGIQSGSCSTVWLKVGLLSVAMKQKSPKRWTNAHAAVISLVVDKLETEVVLTQHIFGVVNFEADGSGPNVAMTMTMTHSEKSIQQTLVAWRNKRERRSHDPAKKCLLKLVWLALLARFALTHCRSQCAVHRITRIQVARILEFCATQQRRPGGSRKTSGQREKVYGRYRSSSVRPDFFPPLFVFGMVVRSFIFSIAQSRLFLGKVFPRTVLLVNPSRCSWVSTHHEVLDCNAAAPAFQKLVGAACGADCVAATAFQKASFSFSFFDFDLLLILCYVMLAISSSLSLTLLTYLAGRRWRFLLCLACSQIFLLLSLCDRFLIESIFHGLLLLWSISVVFVVTFSWNFVRSQSHQAWGIRWYRLTIFFLVYLLLCKSCILNWVQGSISHSVMLLFSAPVLWVLFQHRIFAFSILSMASSVLLFTSSIAVVSISSSISFLKEMSVLIVARVWTLSILVFAFSAIQVFCVVVVIGLVISFLNLSVPPFRLCEPFFHALLWGSKLQRRGSSLVWSPCRRSEVGVEGSTISRSTLACICKTSTRQPLIRCLISVASCCWNILIWPNCFVLSSLVNTSTLMLSISISFVLFELRLIRIFVFSWMYLESHFFCAMFGVTHHFLKRLLCSCKQEHLVSKSQICEAN